MLCMSPLELPQTGVLKSEHADRVRSLSLTDDVILLDQVDLECTHCNCIMHASPCQSLLAAHESNEADKHHCCPEFTVHEEGSW